MASCCYKNRDTSVLVYILVILFGIGSWLAINGLWVELPLLVPQLPEGWDLPSYLVVIIQLANIGPLIYVIVNKVTKGRLNDVGVIYGILIVTSTSTLLLAFLWSLKSDVSGVKHSIPLLSLTFSLSVAACTSSVTFLPYMAVFKTQYITALFIGQGLSGLVPGLVALSQGVGDSTECRNVTVKESNTTVQKLYPTPPNPRFDEKTFFLLLFGILVVAGISFTLLNFLPICRKEQLKNKSTQQSFSTLGENETDSTLQEQKKEDLTQTNGNDLATQKGEKDSSHIDENLTLEIAHDASSNPSATTEMVMSDVPKDKSSDKNSETEMVKGNKDGKLKKFEYILLLIMNGWISAFGNGIIPSLQSYACLPYGSLTYHLAVTLGSVFGTMSSFLAFIVSTRSVKCVWILTMIGTGTAGYLITLAALSPDPPMRTEVAGQVFVIIASIGCHSIFSYTKATIGSIIHMEGKKALLYCGVANQIGSASGALTAFLIVSVFKLLKQMPPCGGQGDE